MRLLTTRWESAVRACSQTQGLHAPRLALAVSLPLVLLALPWQPVAPPLRVH